MTDQTPIPLTDFTRRASAARALIESLLTELIGPVALKYDFFREWSGCWKVLVEITGAATGKLEFTLLETAGGGMLALPPSAAGALAAPDRHPRRRRNPLDARRQGIAGAVSAACLRPSVVQMALTIVPAGARESRTGGEA